MSEYIIQGETLSALADEVRTLSGTSDEMSIDTMKGNLQAANTEIDEQAEKLDELEAAIDELPEAGGGAGSVETCTLTIVDDSMRSNALIYQPSLGEYEYLSGDPMTSLAGTYTCVVGSLVWLHYQANTTATYENCNSVGCDCFLLTAGASENATITLTKQTEV